MKDMDGGNEIRKVCPYLWLVNMYILFIKGGSLLWCVVHVITTNYNILMDTTITSPSPSVGPSFLLLST